MPRFLNIIMLAIAVVSCARPEVEHEEEENEAVASVATDSSSIHELDSEWRDQHDQERTLASTGGKVRLIAMVYTHCTSTCPIIIANMKQIAQALPAEERDDLGFVLVTLDPAADTPARLAAFAAKSGLPDEQWTLLTGSEDATRELSAALAVRYKALKGGDISHSNMITVLDREGRIVYQQVGAKGGASQVAKVIKALF